MSMPFYVAPEQVMKDRAEYAQKGIARGRSLVATLYDRGILLVAENPSSSLHKTYEGTITDEVDYAVLGGDADAIRLRFAEGARTDWSLGEALRQAVSALAGPDRVASNAADLEVAVLADVGVRRTFRRLDDEEVARLLEG